MKQAACLPVYRQKAYLRLQHPKISTMLPDSLCDRFPRLPSPQRQSARLCAMSAARVSMSAGCTSLTVTVHRYPRPPEPPLFVPTLCSLHDLTRSAAEVIPDDPILYTLIQHLSPDQICRAWAVPPQANCGPCRGWRNPLRQKTSL